MERTAVIETGPLQVWVTGTGKVEPAALSSLSFKTTGTLGELAVEVGGIRLRLARSWPPWIRVHWMPACWEPKPI